MVQKLSKPHREKANITAALQYEYYIDTTNNKTMTQAIIMN